VIHHVLNLLCTNTRYDGLITSKLERLRTEAVNGVAAKPTFPKYLSPLARYIAVQSQRECAVIPVHADNAHRIAKDWIVNLGLGHDDVFQVV